MKIELRTLRRITFFYLSFPLFLFFFGWLKLPIALLFSAGLALLVLKSNARAAAETESLQFGPKELVGLLLIALCWISTSGIGGFGLQNGDYMKHNAILKLLIDNPWPTIVRDVGSNDRLVYYFGYYLPPAAIGKLLGWSAANAASLIWAMGGLSIAFLWLGWIAKSYSPLVFIFFAFCGGLDIAGYFIYNGHLPKMTDHIEWWAGLFQFSSNTTLLYWVPQHALAGWIGTPLIITQPNGKHPPISATFGLIITAFWSPFVALGLSPFLAEKWFHYFKNKPNAKRDLKSHGTEMVSLALVALTIATFLQSIDRSRIPHQFFPANAVLVEFMTVWMLFVALEVVCFMIFLSRWPRTTWIALGSLLVIPTYSLGLYNDFGMRASIPALYVLWSEVVSQLNSNFRERRMRAFASALLLVWILGTGASVSELSRSLSATEGFLVQRVPNADWVQPITQIGPHGTEAQYLGNPDLFFFRFLAKNP